MDAGQLDVTQMEYTPDLVDFMLGANDIVYELMLRQRDVALSESLEPLSALAIVHISMQAVSLFVLRQKLQRS